MAADITNPEIANAIQEAGSDVCSHGWHWVSAVGGGEREHIRKAVISLEKGDGSAPRPMLPIRSRGTNTRRPAMQWVTVSLDRIGNTSRVGADLSSFFQ